MTVKITDLDWKPHPLGNGGEHVDVFFPNGYGASCIRGGWGFYTRGGTYEIAVINADDELDYSTSITDDVLGYLSEDEANQALKDIEALPPYKGES